MKVKDLQTSDVQTCSPETNLAAAAQIMWECDCGVVPVVDDNRTLLGMITDRDICIATTTRSAAPADIQVRNVMTTGTVYSCGPEDDVRTALRTMASHRVRRLPVVDRTNRLVGIISMSDVLKRASTKANAEIPSGDVIEALQSITAPTPQLSHA